MNTDRNHQLFKEFRSFVEQFTYKYDEEELCNSAHLKKYLQGVTEFPNQFYYIISLPESELVHISPFTSEILGYDLQRFTPEFLMWMIHEDDREHVYTILQEIIKYAYKLKYIKPFEYVLSLDYRMQKKDGTYIRIMRYITNLTCDRKGHIVHSLNLFTDITGLKKGNFINVRMEGPDCEDFKYNRIPFLGKEQISNREYEVLKYISNGFTSKEIGEKLNISKQTVDTHRKNVIKRLGKANTAELIGYCKEEGYL